MTYFGVLLVFLIPPLLVLFFGASREVWRWRRKRGPAPAWFAYRTILLLVVAALVYTTPWDNYLVATGVWWYDPRLVTGFRLGWVPIEEYTFFVLQTLLTGLWTTWLLRRLPSRPLQPTPALRWGSSLVLGAAWAVALSLWLAGWQPGNYLNLILTWALIPIIIQTTFGADILWAYRKALLPAILAPTLYLWAVDALAIGSGTWTIDPHQTIGLKLGVLPLEEMVFFALTNLVVAQGLALIISPHSQARLSHLLTRRRPLEAERDAPVS